MTRHELMVKAANEFRDRPDLRQELPGRGAVPVFWWPALAPLKPFERLLVRQYLRLAVR